MSDGNPLPSFEGEPELCETVDDIYAYTELLWNNLNEDNKVSLFVRYINIADGSFILDFSENEGNTTNSGCQW